MINLPKESLDILLSCLENNPPDYKYVKDCPTPTIPVDDPAKYRDELVKQILDPAIENYTAEFYNTLRLVVSGMFCRVGLKEDVEPNDYGLRLEKLIDELGRLFM